ncbi:MAG: RNA polymerase factor sigma-54 [Bacteroidales bacterium]|nr:RNA polymerase factor sigma-54 [Bacteroidales bacterium]MCM1146604.1 RNA polymerase factor sigma-54 [Bacteroidales bacterium]MCM1205996.1 RNA polymerase factor sigma-54 [Bacillota bacterium]MCM1510122.1 RNA polymerase factor sigma-54 [Clostridium sp.]
MKQRLSAIQKQEQRQLLQQHLSGQQILVVKMLEMPLAQLEDNVLRELDTNPSLEQDYDDHGAEETIAETAPKSDEEERRDDALSDALDLMGKDDRMAFGKDGEERNFEDGNTVSFIDTLNEQMNLEELSEEEHQIMEYLICSLDDDGLLRKDLQTISDELAIYSNIFVEPETIESVLMKLQEFDPAGIGTRNLKECLLVQVGRMTATPQTMLMYRIIDECYDDFSNNRWERICRQLRLPEQQAEEIRREIRHRLNPKPGAAFGETQGRSMQQITPDFIVHVDYDGNISFELNNGRVPQLHVVREDEELINEMSGTQMNREEKDAFDFTKANVESAKMYIEALRQRNRTLVLAMDTIIKMQRRYFLSGDENDIRPMVLKNVAERTGLDISTISRVSREKYVQTPWGTFPLRHFFSEGYETKDGEIMATKVIKAALKEIIEHEDRKSPLSDEKLVAVMKEKGFPIARRTIAKYREQLGIPAARLRK